MEKDTEVWSSDNGKRDYSRTGTSLGTKLRFFDNRILAKKRKGSKTCASKRGFTEDNSSQSHKRKKDRVAAAQETFFSPDTYLKA